MSFKKKIVFFSGNRSDYSIQEPIIKILKKKTKHNISLIVSGSHTNSKMVGSTFKYLIHNLKFFKITIKGDFNNTKSINIFNTNFQKKFSNLLNYLKPDFIFLTGDRYETFCAGFCAFLFRIPIIHIEGGDMTLGGTYDDVIRHSLSRLSSFHLVTNKLSEKRLNKWDEKNKAIFNIGYPPGEEINKKEYANKIEVEKKFKLKSDQKLIIFTFHPTKNIKSKKKDYDIILKILKNLSEKYKIIITYPNFDPGYKEIIKIYEKLKNHRNILIKKNLGKYMYYGILNYCGRFGNGFCMGNSSSGIKEAIFFKCFVLNLGERQFGRLAPKNVLNVDINYKKILSKIKLIRRKKKIKNEINNPYMVSNFEKKIIDTSKIIFKKKNSQFKIFNI